MIESQTARPGRFTGAAEFAVTAGEAVARYGLVLVVGWIGALKFTAYEAEAIVPLVAHHPLMAWLYEIVGVRTFAGALGVVEVGTALLIATRPLWPRASAAGSALAALLFLGTLSFLLTTPASATGGFPFLSADVGQFLLKDVVLLGASLWTFGEATRATHH
ncbi:DUF417 family protein [Saccharopolyspora gloriosae]|uniref:Putative membrane protein YkgB n=1 Tax=Saccharopolyspora gloriosae TaxID=455344 RepID=A0A840NPH5_9PSEU|nr:DUF417 family protein [Saccharopolyspora gloriosae]MBB5071012.1 putative membrane protein YkgB [Saccharopolyspora gloriosae]